MSGRSPDACRIPPAACARRMYVSHECIDGAADGRTAKGRNGRLSGKRRSGNTPLIWSVIAREHAFFDKDHWLTGNIDGTGGIDGIH
jgi:hypothetical protein